jgi:hypothetical protein
MTVPQRKSSIPIGLQETHMRTRLICGVLLRR